MNNLGDLEIFARVVSAGSMSAAGRELGLSPAVVSKRLRRLEDRLGTRLMQRTTRQISLTEAGQGFYERVVAILAGIEEAEAFVSRRSALAHGVLKVSAPTSFGRMHIAPHINTFMQANPDLDRHICLAPHNNDTWKLEGPPGEVIHRPIGPLQTNSSEVVREAVIGGMGIALRSTWDIGAELSDGRLIQVLPAYEGSRNVAIHAIYASRRFLPAKARLFIDFLAELYGPAPYWDTEDGDR